MPTEAQVEQEFDQYFRRWKALIRHPRISFSSRTEDYIDNEPYHLIIRMGRPALPHVLAKLQQGEFLLNEAAIRIAGLNRSDIYQQETRGLAALDLSEQEASERILQAVPDGII